MGDADDDEHDLSGFICPDWLAYYAELSEAVASDISKAFGQRIAHSFNTGCIDRN